MNGILRVEGLRKHFPVKGGLFQRRKGVVHAVDGVSFHVEEGETLGLVGESGCGKTTTARLVVRLLEPTSGQAYFMDKNIFELGGDELLRFRRQMQIVFQNPFASLNPRKSIRQILTTPLRIHHIVDDKEIEKEASTLLELVGLTPASLYLDRFPHEFSGGQRQRIGIARALTLRPKFVVADEPVSALDMSVRAQVLNLMKKLQRDLGLTYLFITHDLAVVRSLCNRVAVMYLGKIVELADTEQLFENVMHPYTKALLSSTPIPDPEATRGRSEIILEGDVPSAITPPPGCRFHTRCPIKKESCMSKEPELVDVGSGHKVACHTHS
jgi:oligopeptide transport system ATP-binding protein